LPREQRRLAAIVAADVVGYSRLMGIDESGTLAALKELLRDLIDPKITEHGGRIVKTTGDGLLLEFASVVDALRCVIEMQAAMAARNADAPADCRIEFRVGVNRDRHSCSETAAQRSTACRAVPAKTKMSPALRLVAARAR
jgi:adenylate cyclase